MASKSLEIIKTWTRQHPGIFQVRDEGQYLHILEQYSGKALSLRENSLQEVVERTNQMQNQESYLILLFDSGSQLVLSQQGFAFSPDFTNTGPIPLPSQVYCMRDFQDLFHKMEHIASEEDRGREALDLIMILISLLDGARQVGLEVSVETTSVETILSQLEAGKTPPPPHS